MRSGQTRNFWGDPSERFVGGDGRAGVLTPESTDREQYSNFLPSRSSSKFLSLCNMCKMRVSRSLYRPRTISTIRRRVASGRSGHATTTLAKSGGKAPESPPIAGFAPPGGQPPDFPRNSRGVRLPVLSLCGNAEKLRIIRKSLAAIDFRLLGFSIELKAAPPL